MGLETGSVIADLNENWPLGNDPKSQGDDHIRLIKSILKNDAVSLDTAGQVVIGEGGTGWQVMGDLLTCWGDADDNTPIVFPATFQTLPSLGYMLETNAANTRWVSITPGTLSVNGFTPVVLNSSGNPITQAFRWIAVGEAENAIKKPKTVMTIGNTTVTEIHDPSMEISYRTIGTTLEVWGHKAGVVTDWPVVYPKQFAREPAVTASAGNPSGKTHTAMIRDRSLSGHTVRLRDNDGVDATAWASFHAVGEWDGN